MGLLHARFIFEPFFAPTFMKRLLLSLGFSTMTLAAQAQVSPGLLNGVVALGTLIGRSQWQPQDDASVTTVAYRQWKITQKRTPVDKLPQKGGASIAGMEGLLHQCHSTFVADSVTEIIGPEQFRSFSELRRKMQTLPYSWDTRPYDAEMAFYQQQDHLRRQRRTLLAQPPKPPQQPKADSLAPAPR